MDLPENVREVNFFSEMYCSQVDASFKTCIISRTDTLDSKWCQFITHHLEKYDEILIALRFEILSIRYKADIKPYYRPIFMKKSVKYEWKLKEDKVNSFKTWAPGQFALSDTFDRKNNNWGLRICPMTSYDFGRFLSFIKLQ